MSESALELIKRRRTNLRVDPERQVPDELITRLCEAAVWAPNHKLTEPWRFAVFTGEARRTLGAVAAQGLRDRGVDDEDRLETTGRKYLRAPVIVVVGCESDAQADPVRRSEDRDAVAAGIQNLLLTATDLGLASYWGTGLTARLPETAALCGFQPGTIIVGLVYLGWPVADAPVPKRSPPAVNRIGTNSSQ